MRKAECEQALNPSLCSRQKSGCSRAALLQCGQSRPGGSAASSEYLPQRDPSLVFSDFLKLHIEVCLAIKSC